VLPVAFLLLTAAILGRPRSPDSGRGSGSNRNPRLALGGLAVAGLIAIAIPMASASAIRDSQAEVRAQDLPAALDQAHSALDIQPYAATASLQEALVLELQGDLEAARLAAVEATQDEPTNWRTWLVLSRLEAKLGNAEASVDSYREARSLNPRSVLFQ
jgi:tetratricopeptide (TPR) repeat protein